MDRFRALVGKKQTKQEIENDRRRRASHAGFEAPKIEDLRKRRQSLPANMFKKDKDEARKLHNSAACINIIEEMQSVKIIPKHVKHGSGISMPSKHSLDPFLQKQLRARRQSISPLAIETVHAEPILKRATSFETLSSKNKVLDRDIVTLAKSSSESILAGIDVEDPEESEMLEDDIPDVPIATNQLVTA